VRHLKQKDTGSYLVGLVDFGETGEEYAIVIQYTGPHGSGEVVLLIIDGLQDATWSYESVPGADKAARRWFMAQIKNDGDVINILEAQWYDRFGHRARHI